MMEKELYILAYGKKYALYGDKNSVPQKPQIRFYDLLFLIAYNSIDTNLNLISRDRIERNKIEEEIRGIVSLEILNLWFRKLLNLKNSIIINRK